jgi:hypothetical protein
VHFSAPFGFALALPAALVVASWLVHDLPRAAEARGGCGATARTIAVALVLIVTAIYARESLAVYSLATHPVGRGGDRFFTMDPAVSSCGPVVGETLAAIEILVPEDAGFAAIPDGVMLNYLARRRNPGKWFEFTPPIVAAAGERRIRDELERGRPDFVVLLSLPADAASVPVFGNDYGSAVRDWIVENYAPVRQIGGKLFSGVGCGVVIAARKRRD